MGVNTDTTSKRLCCQGKPSDAPWLHSSDCHAHFSNGNAPEGEFNVGQTREVFFRQRTTRSGNAFASIPSTNVWQAPRSFSHFGNVVEPKNNERFRIKNDDRWDTILAPDRELIANVDYQRRLLVYADGLSLARLRHDGTLEPNTSHIKPQRNHTAILNENVSLSGSDPSFERDIDMSDSDEETPDERPKHSVSSSYYPFAHHHPRYPRTQSSHAASLTSTTDTQPPNQGTTTLTPRSPFTLRVNDHQQLGHTGPEARFAQDITNTNSLANVRLSTILDDPKPAHQLERKQLPTIYPAEIPNEIQKISTVLNSCPEDECSHGLPPRIWLKKQDPTCIGPRYGTFKPDDKRPNPILEYVGDTRLFSRRMWAYLLFPGKAMPEGKGPYERDFEAVYGGQTVNGNGAMGVSRTEICNAEDMAISEAGRGEKVDMFQQIMAEAAAHVAATDDRSEPASMAAMTSIHAGTDGQIHSEVAPIVEAQVASEEQQPESATFHHRSPWPDLDVDENNNSMAKTRVTPPALHASLSVPAFISPDIQILDPSPQSRHQTALQAQSPSPSPPSTPELFPLHHSTKPCTYPLSQNCSNLHQACINSLQCTSTICATCEPLQMSHLKAQERRSLELGALMPICQDCQQDFLRHAKGGSIVGMAERDLQLQRKGIEQYRDQDLEPESECLCLETQCLPCLRLTASIMAKAREVYLSDGGFKLFWTKVLRENGEVAGIAACRCPCGKIIQGAEDEVRVCACCGGRVLKRDYVGATRGWWGTARRVWYLAGCEGILDEPVVEG